MPASRGPFAGAAQLSIQLELRGMAFFLQWSRCTAAVTLLQPGPCIRLRPSPEGPVAHDRLLRHLLLVLR